MRILIVGGGVAGLTLAALLRQRGEEPTVVEAMEEYGRVRYTVTLRPMGNRVLRGLGLIEGFRKCSTALERTVMWDKHGKVLRIVDVKAGMALHSEARTLERTDLIDLLRSQGGGIPVRMGTRIERIEQDERSETGVVQVLFNGDSEEEFDLLVGANGFRSGLRSLVLGRVVPRRTGSVLFWWWQEAPDITDGKIVQYAGVGRFFGVYTVRDRVSCVAVLPEGEVSTNGWGDSTEERRALLQGSFDGFNGESLRTALDRLGGAECVDQIEVVDLRAPEWRRGRVFLLGDAAATLLPSVGAGAATAMESAAVLSDELLRADARYLSGDLRLYAKRRRKQVAGLQNGSRTMFRVARTRRLALAALRDMVFRMVPEGMLLKDVEKSLEQPL